MAIFTITIGSFATGQVSGNPPDESIQVTSRPIVDFLASLDPPVDLAAARIILEVPDSEITSGDFDDDGFVESWISDQTPITRFQIDIGGDGTPDYDIRGQNPNDNQIYTGNQEGDNIARFNGNATIYETGTTNVAAQLPSGNLYLSNDGPFPPAPGLKAVENESSGRFIVVNNEPVAFPPCFTRGVEIQTPLGPRRIEELAVGDLVTTLDNGSQPIRWIGSRLIGRDRLQNHHGFIPVRIPAGALGEGIPQRDLIVSQQHRMVLASPMVRDVFGVCEVLVPAKKLVGIRGIEYETPAEVEYFHILLDQHQVVIANGALSETLLPGPMALKSLDKAARHEIMAIFPELATEGYAPVPVRQIPASKPLREYLRRQVANPEVLADLPLRRIS